MISLLLEERCEPCGACVAVCPSNVFAPGPAGRPVIAQPDQCQTCFLCELYCPTDALYVDPDCEQRREVEPGAVQHLLGQYRRESGWGEWADVYVNEHWRMGEIFARARAMAPPPPAAKPKPL